MHSSIRREQKKVHLSMSRIFNHQKRRIPHIKPTCAFYEFGPEKKEYEELCADLPFPIDSSKPPSSALFDFRDHIFSFCTNFCRHLMITGKKDPILYAYCCCAPGNEHVIHSSWQGQAPASPCQTPTNGQYSNIALSTINS